MAKEEEPITSDLLKTWTASWKGPEEPPNATASTAIHWCPPKRMININRGRPDTVLTEHPLKTQAREHEWEYEYSLLFRWIHGKLPTGPTDRDLFAQRRFEELEDTVQEGGANTALTTWVKLLKDHMVFSEDGKLAEGMTYPRRVGENETGSQ